MKAWDTCLTRDKEIPKWHRAPYLTITISKGNQRNSTRNEGRSLLTNHYGDGPTRGRRGLFGRPVQTTELVELEHYSCKASDSNA